MNCGRILKEIRLAKGLTLAEVATRFNRTIGWLSNVEANRRPLKMADFVELCRIYDVKPERILRMAEQGPTRTTQTG